MFLPGFLAFWMALTSFFTGQARSVHATPVVKAFPGAMGYGTDTPGGRGGRVIYVTTLDDSGPGSLREALLANEARMVLFEVSGTITLQSDIVVTSPFLTIAGHTAPGEGVQVRGSQIKIATHDVVIRYMKIRTGDSVNASNPADRDATTLNDHTKVYNVVIDHSTMIWGPDVGGVTFLNGSRDSTVSYSIIGEGLYYSDHPEATSKNDGHSMALNITELKSENHPMRITLHHNLITTSNDRNPRVIGGENIDIVNNVIYNWRNSPSQGNPRSLNLINNYYIKGPMSTKSSSLVAWLPKAERGSRLRRGSVYESGNLTEGLTKVRGGPANVYVSSRFSPYSMEWEDDPEAAYDTIVQDVGANLQVAGPEGGFQQVRDSVDNRIVNNLINRTGTFFNGVGHDGRAGYPEIAWPVLEGGQPGKDLDRDGMADAWEMRQFGVMAYGSPTDSSSDFDGDGYTDLEEYLYGTDPTVPTPAASPFPLIPQTSEGPLAPNSPENLLEGKPLLANTIIPAAYTKRFCPDVVATLNVGSAGYYPTNRSGYLPLLPSEVSSETNPSGTRPERILIHLSCHWVD
jgi:pectate lyase